VHVSDAWSGGTEVLLGMWPSEEFHPDQHEHAHHDGCFYAHRHPGGSAPHGHIYECASPQCRHIYEQEPPRAALT